MRTYAQIKEEVEAEKAKRIIPNAYCRDNLVFLLQWPEYNNTMVYCYEFDAGPRVVRYGRKSGREVPTPDSYKEYNVYHANTLVILISTGVLRPCWYNYMIYWTKQPWEIAKEKTELYVPPYSNLDDGGMCMGDNFGYIHKSPENYEPKGWEKYHIDTLNWMLYNSVWTNGMADRVQNIIPAQPILTTPEERFAIWEKLGEKAVGHFQWAKVQSKSYPTLQHFFSKTAEATKKYQARR